MFSFELLHRKIGEQQPKWVFQSLPAFQTCLTWFMWATTDGIGVVIAEDYLNGQLLLSTLSSQHYLLLVPMEKKTCFIDSLEKYF